MIKLNFILLAFIVVAVLVSGFWKPGISYNFFGIDLQIQNLIRDFLLILIAMVSIKVTKKELLTGIAEFERTIENQSILEAVEALQRLNADNKSIQY